MFNITEFNYRIEMLLNPNFTKNLNKKLFKLSNSRPKNVDPKLIQSYNCKTQSELQVNVKTQIRRTVQVEIHVYTANNYTNLISYSKESPFFGVQN